MGYFPNSAEGSGYQQDYCDRCLHDVNRDCPVWLLHLMHNGDETLFPVLEQLIPRTEDGRENEQCLMFVPREPTRTQQVMRELREVVLDPARAAG